MNAGSHGGSNCPLGDEDADGNGYPDSCETLLWKAEGSSFTPLDLPGFQYSAGMVGFLEVSVRDGSRCPELNGTGVPRLGHATSFPSGQGPSSKTVDAQSDEAARVLAACLERDDAMPISLIGSVAGKTATDTSGSARALYDAQPFQNHLNGGTNPADVSIAGTHVLYFRITMKKLSITSYDGTLGTTVSSFDATVEAVGH